MQLEFDLCIQSGRNKGGKAGGRSSGTRAANAGGGAAQQERSPRSDLGPSQMNELVPENAGNSRVYAASKGLRDGSLNSQEGLRDFDIQNYLSQASGLNSRNVNNLARADGGSIKVPVANTTVSVSRENYRRFSAQASRDTRTLYNRANNETKDTWARELRGNAPTSSRNPAVRRIARDLNQRYERIQETEAKARRAARQSKSRSGGNDLAGLFG